MRVEDLIEFFNTPIVTTVPVIPVALSDDRHVIITGNQSTCPFCERDTLTSCLETKLVTLRRANTFYDESGNYHRHVLGPTCLAFKCTQSHQGKISEWDDCPEKCIEHTRQWELFVPPQR